MKNQEYPTHMYPPQMPSAPPTYSEAMNQGNVANLGPPPPMGFAPSVQATIPPGSYRPPPHIIEVQRTVVSLPLGPYSCRIKCPHCQTDVLTQTDSEPSCVAHLCCLLLLLVGCCPLSCVPYCMDSLRNVRHSCPRCKMFIGNYQP